MLPQGHHLGLYKTWLHVPEENKEEYRDIQSDDIFQVIAQTINLYKIHQTAIASWLNVHNISILKQPGVYKINKLRTIHKLESRVNLQRREIITRRLMNNAEKHRYLDDDQHGGQNCRSTIDIVLGKAFTFDIVHFQRANTRCTDYDAKACYVRILPIVLLLTYFKVGFLYAMCVFFAHLLYNIKYFITTAYGPGAKCNYFGLFVPLFKIVQGSTDGPTGWTCISDIALKCYHKMCN